MGRKATPKNGGRERPPFLPRARRARVAPGCEARVHNYVQPKSPLKTRTHIFALGRGPSAGPAAPPRDPSFICLLYCAGGSAPGPPAGGFAPGPPPGGCAPWTPTRFALRAQLARFLGREPTSIKWSHNDSTLFVQNSNRSNVMFQKGVPNRVTMCITECDTHVMTSNVVKRLNKMES